jgi:hypothetical protein
MNDDREQSGTRLSRGGWLTVIVLAGFLGWAIWYAVHAWGALAGVGITTAGWVMLGLGVVVTLFVGGGLMGLLFYSSRKNFDR